MKKKTLITGVFLVLGFIFLVSPSAFAEPYDGVWWSPDYIGTTSFFMIRQVGGTIVAITFELYSDAPVTVLLGSFSGNTAHMSSEGLTPSLLLDVTATFSSDSSGTFTVNSCSPASECEETPMRFPIPVEKLF